MKRILSIIALLMAFAANGFAQDDPTFYVVGNFTEWTNSPSTSAVIQAMQLLTGTEDTYYADFTPEEGEKFFCIADGDGVGEDAWADFNSNHRYSSNTANQEVNNGCYSIQLATNGDRSLKLTADGTTTYRIMFVANTHKLTVTKVDNYVVAGCFVVNDVETASFFGTKWDATSEANKMTLLTDGSYKKTYEGIDLSAGDIKYKITNADWKHKTEADQTKNIAEAGKYNITFQFWVDNINSPVCTIERVYPTITTVGLSGDVAASLTKGEGYVWTGELALDSRLTENKTFRLNVDNAVIGSQKLTLVGNGLVTASETENDPFTLLATSPYQTYNVTAEWTPSDDVTAGWKLTIAGKDKEVPVSYAIVGDWTDDGAGWAADQAMTQDTENPNIYTLTVNNFEVDFTGEETSKTYSYKLRANGKWGVYDLPASGNYNKVFNEEGTYKLVFTADISENTLNLDVTKKTVLPGTVIWSSETPVAATWYTNNYDLIIDKSKFANVKVGDKIHVAVMNVPEDGPDYGSQVQLSDGWWVKVEGYMAVGSGNVSDASFVITGDMLKLFKERGMIVVGQNFSTDQVTVESIEGITGSDNSVWVGNSTSAITIKKEHFLTAHDWVHVGPGTYDYAFEGIKAGDIIRVTASENENAGNKWLIAQYSGSDTDWAWKDYSTDLMPKFTTATGFDFVIPEDYIDQIKTDGVIINFSGYTVTQVELIIPNGDYYVINDLGSGWAVGSKMTESEGTYTATLTGMAGKYFAIVPSTSLNASGDALFSWANVVRPVSNGNFLVEFKSYTGTDNITYTGSNVWAVQTENDADLTINFTPASKSFTLSCAKTIEMSSVGYRTYSNAQNYKVADGTSVYYVKEVGESIKLTAAESNILPGTGTGNKAGRGIILKGSSNVVISSVASDAETAALEDNMLVGTGDWDYGLSGYGNDYTCFILAIGDNGVGFYNATGTVGAHKAFLPILTSTLSTTAREFLGFEEGNTTSIDVRSKMEDVRGDVYNLNGQRVAQPTKGLYIVNGRKVVIK